MKLIKEFTLNGKKLNFDEAKANVPDGYRMPTKKELMLMYVMAEEENLTLPQSNVWSSDEYFLKTGESTSAFTVQLNNGYTATLKKVNKVVAMYVKA